MKGMYPTADKAQGGGGVRPNRMKAPTGGGSHPKGTMSGGDTTRFKGTMGSGKSSPKCKGAMGMKY